MYKRSLELTVILESKTTIQKKQKTSITWKGLKKQTEQFTVNSQNEAICVSVNGKNYN